MVARYGTLSIPVSILYAPDDNILDATLQFCWHFVELPIVLKGRMHMAPDISSNELVIERAYVSEVFCERNLVRGRAERQRVQQPVGGSVEDTDGIDQAIDDEAVAPVG